MKRRPDTGRLFSLDAHAMPKRARLSDDDDGLNWLTGKPMRHRTTFGAADKRWLREFAGVAWDKPEPKDEFFTLNPKSARENYRQIMARVCDVPVESLRFLDEKDDWKDDER